ncbi:AglZ/HisF2 family acetamidino modification protein [Devosia sp. ZB163]|uniref:AglZ/HisF2 family acetamidino modification protein n=1 Tax=Devosia sp. ZB163 TaxID=3025938 RepID=UPI002362F60B|nr:AglZ/HisF2 family acetamidino modification protein [Devosia sp. ZB163]MDC9823046.1 AglZ/HisF2 family acetamidino modification protein [Devosia sp. ZB163]
MLRHRVIPTLLLRNGGLVKTTRFSSPRYVGDPLNAIRIFNEKEVDELLVFDITASRERRAPNFEAIQELAAECFMPFCYGGGISTIEHAERLFALGVEKVSLQTATARNLELITRIATKFGSQAVVAAVDVKKSWGSGYKLYWSASGRTERDWQGHLRRVVGAGAGEVVLNAVDRDGTMQGVDADLIRIASNDIEVPLVALGGVGSLDDIRVAIEAGASAVAAGAFFVYHGKHRAVLITYPPYATLERLMQNR